MTRNAKQPVDVFLSYARENRVLAKRLAIALTEARGWSVWWDAHLRTGERFNREIERVVSTARCVVVLWSTHSVESDWVVAEVSEGWERGVLVPILIGECQPPLPFRQVQATDLSGWRGSTSASGFLELLEDIQRVMAHGGTIDSTELAARDARRRRLHQLRWGRRAAVAAVFVALMAAAWWGWQRQGNADQADAIAAQSQQIRDALLADYDQSSRTWWSYLFDYRSHSRQVELAGLLAAEAYDIARTPVTEAALADAWALMPWTDKGQQFDNDHWHSSLRFSHDGRFVAGGGGEAGSVIWDTQENQIVARINHGGLAPPDQRTSSARNRGTQVLASSPSENLLATAGPDETARLWSTTGEALASLTHSAPVTAATFSPDGTLLAATDESGALVIWNVATQLAVHQLGHSDYAEGPVFSPSGTYVGSVSSDGTAMVWQVSDGKPVATLKPAPKRQGDTFDGLAFSPSELTAVTFGNGLPTVFYALPGGEELWRDTDGSFAGVVFSNNGDVVVTGGVDLAWWSMATNEKLFSIEQASISAIEISSDGRFIGTASSGDTVQVWDAETGREVKRIPMYRWGPSLAFSPDSTTLAVGGFDEYRNARVLEIVNLLPENLRTAICSGISANFSRNEWRRYFAQTPYQATCPDVEEYE